jgi:integrase
MLRLARKWGVIRQVPEIELPKKPEPRERYLDLNEIQRLMAACTVSKNPHLAAIVTIAINTGMRKAEILVLEWARVELSTSHHGLPDEARQGPRRPINRAVYEALVAIQPNAALRDGWVFTTRNAGPGDRSGPRSPRHVSGPGSRASGSTTCGTRAPRTWSCAALAAGGQGDPRPLRPQADTQVRAPLAEPSSGGRRGPRRAH